MHLFMLFHSALFWTDWDGKDPRIEGCSMSGENRKLVFNISSIPSGGWPNGLSIDYDFRRLYWIDARYVTEYYQQNMMDKVGFEVTSTFNLE